MDRFLLLSDVADVLKVSPRIAAGLIKSGELPAIKVHNSWRIEATKLEEYIANRYKANQAEIQKLQDADREDAAPEQIDEEGR